MAATESDPGEDSDQLLPFVSVRLTGPLGAPLISIPGAVLSPADAVLFAQKIFAVAASACRQSRYEVAGSA